jgi:hypothetical protein
LSPIYLAVGLAAVGLYTVSVCPHCPHDAATACPSGYPHRLRRPKKRGSTDFARQFRRGTMLLYPTWFVPPIAGVVALVRAWSCCVLGLLALFCLVSFVILPHAYRRLCANCENEVCPRKRRG